MTLGIIVRVDEGGLGVLTVEVARHVEPDGVLIVEVDPPRGTVDLARATGLAPQVWRVRWPHRADDARAWQEFLDVHDVIYTAESFYGLGAKSQGRRVLHAMPELFNDAELPADVWLPTSWNANRVPGARLMPVPVDRERCAPRDVDRVKRMLHVSAPAMLDRNGTQLVRAALPECREHFELYVSGPDMPNEPVQVGKVLVRPAPAVRDYWRLYDDMDALVLPRRYGGLCLPMQEAASIGLPIVSLALEPQLCWLLPELAVPARQQSPPRAQMKGGDFLIHDCDPHALARTLDLLVADNDIAARAHAASLHWGQTLDWARWIGPWKEALA